MDNAREYKGGLLTEIDNQFKKLSQQLLGRHTSDQSQSGGPFVDLCGIPNGRRGNDRRRNIKILSMGRGDVKDKREGPMKLCRCIICYVVVGRDGIDWMEEGCGKRTSKEDQEYRQTLMKLVKQQEDNAGGGDSRLDEEITRRSYSVQLCSNCDEAGKGLVSMYKEIKRLEEQYSELKMKIRSVIKLSGQLAEENLRESENDEESRVIRQLINTGEVGSDGKGKSSRRAGQFKQIKGSSSRTLVKSTRPKSMKKRAFAKADAVEEGRKEISDKSAQENVEVGRGNLVDLNYVPINDKGMYYHNEDFGDEYNFGEDSVGGHANFSDCYTEDTLLTDENKEEKGNYTMIPHQSHENLELDSQQKNPQLILVVAKDGDAAATDTQSLKIPEISLTADEQPASKKLQKPSRVKKGIAKLGRIKSIDKAKACLGSCGLKSGDKGDGKLRKKPRYSVGLANPRSIQNIPEEKLSQTSGAKRWRTYRLLYPDKTQREIKEIIKTERKGIKKGLANPRSFNFIPEEKLSQTSFSVRLRNLRAEHPEMSNREIKQHLKAQVTKEQNVIECENGEMIPGRGMKGSSGLRLLKRTENGQAFYKGIEIKNDSDGTWYCSLCGPNSTKCKNNRSVVTHINKHHVDLSNAYECEHCGKRFYYYNQLDFHIREKHQQEKYQCHICGNFFSNRSAKFHHIRIIHEGHKPNICEHCGKAFGTKKDLTVHVRRHTGEKPFCCHLCPARFVVNSGLNKHLLNSHPNGIPQLGGKCDYSCIDDVVKQLVMRQDLENSPSFPSASY